MARIAGWSVLFLILGTFSAQVLSGESLWDSDSAGFYTGHVRLKEGDLLRVVFDGEASLSFLSTKTTDKTLTIEFTGGDAAMNPAASVPKGHTGDNLKLQGKSEWKSKNASVVVKVVKIDSGGTVEIEGKRTLLVGGGSDTVSLKGVVDSRDIRGRDVSWRLVGDLVVQFVSASESAQNLVSQTDLSTDQKGISPEKQRALMLKFYNRFLDTLFPSDSVSSETR